MIKIMTEKMLEEEKRKAREKLQEEMWQNNRIERLEHDVAILSDKVGMLEIMLNEHAGVPQP